MATEQFISRGGTEAEYSIYRALHQTGRREPGDFVFKPAQRGMSFFVSSPRTFIRVGGTPNPLADAAISAPVANIEEGRALEDAQSALEEALGG